MNVRDLEWTATWEGDDCGFHEDDRPEDLTDDTMVRVCPRCGGTHRWISARSQDVDIDVSQLRIN